MGGKGEVDEVGVKKMDDERVEVEVEGAGG